MVFYDGTTYDYIHNHHITSSDVEMLNKMQAISAQTNIYFKDWETRGEIESLVRQAEDLRKMDKPMVEELGSEEDENESLIHSFEQKPNISLSLSFLKVKKKALRRPLQKRALVQRKKLQDRPEGYTPGKPRRYPNLITRF